MNKRILPLASLFSLIMSSAFAQQQSIERPSYQYILNHADEFVNHLRPIVINGDKFGLDLTAAKVIVPGISTDTPAWKTRGKNDYYTVNEPAVNLQQLVLLLTAALQQQSTKLNALVNEIEQLKGQIELSPNPYNNKPGK